MRDAKMAILEDQLDTLAGRLADTEERFELLLKVLTTGQVPRKLGLKGEDIKSRCEVPLPEHRRWKHEEERRHRLAKADLDDFRRRVADVESVAERSDRSFIEAWDATQGCRDDKPGADSTRPPVLWQPKPTVWNLALAHLSTIVNRYSFLTWLADTTLLRDEGTTLVIRTADRMAAAWLQEEYTEIVKGALAAVGRPGASVQFVADNQEEA